MAQPLAASVYKPCALAALQIRIGFRFAAAYILLNQDVLVLFNIHIAHSGTSAVTAATAAWPDRVGGINVESISYVVYRRNNSQGTTNFHVFRQYGTMRISTVHGH